MNTYEGLERQQVPATKTVLREMGINFEELLRLYAEAHEVQELTDEALVQEILEAGNYQVKNVSFDSAVIVGALALGGDIGFFSSE